MSLEDRLTPGKLLLGLIGLTIKVCAIYFLFNIMAQPTVTGGDVMTIILAWWIITEVSWGVKKRS
jgi:hypothetical protein